jgi:DNA-binding GntR family transcriptional regulator
LLAKVYRFSRHGECPAKLGRGCPPRVLPADIGGPGAPSGLRPFGGRALNGPDAVARAHAQLRGLIVRGVLEPGSQLSQVELARRTGVSTTPLREALRRLEAEGLVESRPNRRPRVRPFACDDLDSVYAARVLLEPLAVRLTVPRLSYGDLGELRERLAAMKLAGMRRRDDTSPWRSAAWEVAHHAFHMLLIGGAPQPLREQIETLIARADRYRRIAVQDDTAAGRTKGDAEHEQIVKACEEGDGARAAGALVAQLVRSARTVQAIVVGGAGGLPALDAALACLGEFGQTPRRRRQSHAIEDDGPSQPTRTPRRGDVEKIAGGGR